MKRFTYADRVDGGKKFDIQLGAAVFDEEQLAQRLQHAKLELKSERHLWEQTGNICIEYSRGGSKSGIATTAADFWVHELARGEETLAYLFIPTTRLKEICRRAYRAGRIRKGVGDQNKSNVVLLRLADLLIELAPKEP